MRRKEATRGYCSESRWGWDDDEGGEGHGHQDETRAQRRCEPAVTRSDSCRIGRTESCESLPHVAQFLSINSLVSALEASVLTCLVSSEENTSLKAGMGTILNNRNVCTPKQKDAAWKWNNHFTWCLLKSKSPQDTETQSLTSQQATVARKKLLLCNRKEPWVGANSYGDQPADCQAKEEDRDQRWEEGRTEKKSILDILYVNVGVC